MNQLSGGMGKQDLSEYFTLVFKGDIRTIKLNPFTTETPFGVAVIAGVGDAFERIDELEQLLDRRE